MATDLFTSLKTYLNKLNSGEKTPQELASALNQWAKESGDAIKARIEEEVEKSVKRMGFAKKSDLERLEKEFAELKKQFGSRSGPVAKKKKSATTRTVPVKKSTTKKTAARAKAK